MELCTLILFIIQIMKTQNWIFLALMVFFFAACSSENKKETEEKKEEFTYKKADWTDKMPLQMLISNDYTKKTLEVGTRWLTLSDPRAGQVICMIELNANDSTFQTSENNLVWSLKAINSNNDSLILDYNLAWDKNIVNADSTRGGAMLEGVNVRRIGKKTFYSWRKAGEYWEKESANKTQQIQ